MTVIAAHRGVGGGDSATDLDQRAATGVATRGTLDGQWAMNARRRPSPPGEDVAWRTASDPKCTVVGTVRTTARLAWTASCGPLRKLTRACTTYGGMIATIRSQAGVVTRYGIEVDARDAGGVGLFGYAHRPSCAVNQHPACGGGTPSRPLMGLSSQCWPTTK